MMLLGLYTIIGLLLRTVYTQETIYLQDPDDATTTTLTNAPAQPTGGALALHQDYNGDVGLYLGPELINSLISTIESTCTADSMSCESSTQDVLVKADYDLQSRAIGFVLFVGGLVLAAFAHEIIEVYKQSGMIPKRVHIAAPIVSAIQAAEQASDVYLAATNEPVVEVPITEVPTAISTPTSASAPINPNTLTGTEVQISVATNGNYLVQIHDPIALTWLQNEANKSCNSTDSKKHRRSAADCAPQLAADAMAALPNDLINFLTIDRIAPLVTGGALAASLTAIFNAGRSIAQLVAFSDDTILAAAELFLVLFHETLTRQQPIAAINTLPASDFARTSTITSTKSGSCPTGSAAPACEDSTCLGQSIGTCTSSGTVSGCSCAPLVTPYIYTADVSWLSAQQSIISAIVKQGPIYPPRPTCTYDGAPWMAPLDWCECWYNTPSALSNSVFTFPTLSPSSSSDGTTTITPNCNYSILPAKTIQPITATPAPTNIPGENGIPACVYVSYPDETACPFADYCNCDGIGMRFRTITTDGQTITNCNYTIQPTADDCPPPTITIPSPSSSSTSSIATTTTTLKCNPTDNDDYQMFSRDKALGSITALCNTMHQNSVALSEESTKDTQLGRKDATTSSSGSGDVGIGVTALYTSAGCTSPQINFGSITVDTCVNQFLPAMDSCPDLVQPDGVVNWKIGGSYFHNCTQWSIVGYSV